MFFDLFINIEIKYEDDDYKIFEQSIIDMYNVENIQCDFYDELKYIKLLQYKYVDECIPSFDVDYNKCILSNDYYISNPTYTKAKKRIETKEELENYCLKFKKIFNNSLSYAEKVIFIDYFILKKGREPVKERLRIGNERFKVIKSSCLIKFALGLDFEKANNRVGEKL